MSSSLLNKDYTTNIVHSQQALALNYNTISLNRLYDPNGVMKFLFYFREHEWGITLLPSALKCILLKSTACYNPVKKSIKEKQKL